MKPAKQGKRAGRSPKGKGRLERSGRVSSGQERAGFSYEKSESAYENTGVFSGVSSPRLVGVSDTVRIANRNLARRAKRAEREWLRSLPKGVKV